MRHRVAWILLGGILLGLAPRAEPAGRTAIVRHGSVELSTDSAGGLFVGRYDSVHHQVNPVALVRPPSIRLADGTSIATRFSQAVALDTMLVAGTRTVLLRAEGRDARGTSIAAKWIVELSTEEEGVITVGVSLTATSGGSVDIAAVTVTEIITDARWFGADSAHAFWSFQGGTYPERPDWIFPLTPGFARENFQGMNAPDYGGGIPAVDLWARSGGIALASLADRPEQIALPVHVGSDGSVHVGLEDRTPARWKEGTDVHSIPFTVILHRGDFFAPFRRYAAMMERRGVLRRHEVPVEAYGAEWCAWGYERTFVPAQILRSLPLVQRVGFAWVTVDDGYQNADGDWDLDQAKFPNGDRDMRVLVDSIHARGLKARLWWVLLEAHDSAYSAVRYPDRMKEFGMAFSSRLAEAHPEWFQLNADGSRTQVSWWNSYTLCPAVPEVRKHYVDLVTKFIRTWGFDGFKVDGQNMNAVPPCYNPAHHHASPFDAPRALPLFFREIYDAATTVLPRAVFYVCACGTNFSLYNLSFVTMPVAADPLSAWQVRHRGKLYKALLGSSVPYSGDHVELTNRRWDEALGRSVISGTEDFASTIGIGGVIASKCTAPGVPQPDTTLVLTPEKEGIWSRWIAIARRERLSEGNYLNLYDLAFDKPEMHAIARGDTMYYALYAAAGYTGTVQLRGLGTRQYSIIDYEHGVVLGEVSGPDATLPVTVSGSLLLKAIPNDR